MISITFSEILKCEQTRQGKDNFDRIFYSSKIKSEVAALNVSGVIGDTYSGLLRQILASKMTDTRRRVKLYELNAERQWDDKGTGHVSSTYVERLKGISLVVRSEQDASLLLESKIHSDTAYQKQQETLIVWSEGDNFDLALSFQERAGCDEIWEKICHVQGKDPSVDFTQDLVEDSEDDRGFDEISESAPPIELPAAELSKLEEISELVQSCLSSPLRREKLATAIENDNYIKVTIKTLHLLCQQLSPIIAIKASSSIHSNKMSNSLKVFNDRRIDLCFILETAQHIPHVRGLGKYRGSTSPLRDIQKHFPPQQKCSFRSDVLRGHNL